MHIGVDATCWQLPRGFGRHSRCLLTALRQVDPDNHYTFFTDAPAATEELSAIAPVRLVKTSSPTLDAAAANNNRTIGDLVAMSRAMSDRSIDVLLFPTAYSYVPVFSRAKKVVVIHDVTAERYPGLTLDGARSRWLWTIKSTLSRRQADAIATVSDYSRQALVDEFGLDPDRIHVIGEASDPIFRRLEPPRPTARLVSFGLTGARRLVVYLGGFSPHKNVPRLIEAFGHLADREDCTDVDLVLVGGYEHETFHTAYQDTRERIRTLALDRRVILTGFLPDADLVALLNLATVLVLPSMTEGYGLAAIEAAACGCPVIATTESPLPKLLGEGGLYIDPRNPPELLDALNRVLTSRDRQEYMRRAGLAAAARLTWTAAARDLVRLMHDTMLQ
jgi:glycosyltransferase involved in cell wall biosynthesis